MPTSEALSRHLRLLGMQCATLLACCLSLFSSGCGSQAAETPAGLYILNPGPDARPHFHDYGHVPFGDAATHVFQMRNGDPEPITIKSLQGGCACIRVSRISCTTQDGTTTTGNPRSKKSVIVIPPGAQLDLAVRMDTSQLRNPNKEKLEILRMMTTSIVTPYPTFELHVKSQQLFQFSPRRLLFGDVPSSSGAESMTRIVTSGFGDQAKVLEVIDPGKHCEAVLEQGFLNGEHLWTVRVRLPEFLSKGPIIDEIVLSTTDENGEGNEGRERIEILAQITGDIVMNPRLLSFGSKPLGSAALTQGVLRALVPGTRVLVQSIEIEGDAAKHLRAEAVAIGPDSNGASHQWDILLHLDDQVPAGRFDGKLRVLLDDSQTPEVVVNYSGFMR
ncbi:MAG: hypothetical protein ACI835_000728 [Planctomycetota bacterium]